MCLQALQRKLSLEGDRVSELELLIQHLRAAQFHGQGLSPQKGHPQNLEARSATAICVNVLLAATDVGPKSSSSISGSNTWHERVEAALPLPECHWSPYDFDDSLYQTCFLSSETSPQTCFTSPFNAACIRLIPYQTLHHHYLGDSQKHQRT